MQTAILGGGCFWCLEAVYLRLKGVTRVESGYMGGHVAQPDYESVCGAKTGHAEVVRITFDPAVIGYPELLDVFFEIHDPTTLNRQGNDVGPQYRSIIFALTPEQLAAAASAIAGQKRGGLWAKPIVTELIDLTAQSAQVDQSDQTQTNRQAATEHTFWPAEAEHHNYFNRHPTAGYCVFVVAPKVIKATEKFKALIAQ